MKCEKRILEFLREMEVGDRSEIVGDAGIEARFLSMG